MNFTSFSIKIWYIFHFIEVEKVYQHYVFNLPFLLAFRYDTQLQGYQVFSGESNSKLQFRQQIIAILSLSTWKYSCYLFLN